MKPDAVTIVQERADRFEGRAKRQAKRIIRKLVLIALALAMAMWVFIGWSQWSEYSVAEAGGRRQGSNLTAAAAIELTRNFDSVAAALRVVESAVRQLSPDLADADRRAEMRRIGATVVNPDIGVQIADTDGHLIFASIPSADVAGQRHFIAHRDNPSREMTVDPPFGPEGDKRMQISQRLDTQDGGFAGEVILLVRPASLLQLFQDVDVGRRGMATISSADGIVQAGFNAEHSNGQAGIGTDLRGAPFPENLKPGEAAVYARIGRLVPIERLITIRRLWRYPLNVMIALDEDDVMGSARAHAMVIGLVGVGAIVLIAVLTWLLGREVWRRTKREIELAYDRDRLRSAQEQITQDRAMLMATNLELIASKQLADSANQARSQFLAHMSHELRTPLHAIIGFAELIQDQAPTKAGAPPIASYAADIWGAGKHLLELINTVLDISKVESGTATLTETVFPVAEAIRNSLMTVRSQAEARNIPIDLRLPKDTVRINADRTRMVQILINLLSNAVKFTPDNGQIVMAFAEADSGELVFSVTDTGIGMSEAEIAIALEPFGQVDNALSRSFEGTGLGLPLARKLTELHGGRLEITSTKGKGTIAKVILPSERLRQREAARIAGV